MSAILFCAEHPAYKGDGEPTLDCPGCSTLAAMVRAGYIVAAPAHSGGVGRVKVVAGS